MCICSEGTVLILNILVADFYRESEFFSFKITHLALHSGRETDINVLFDVQREFPVYIYFCIVVDQCRINIVIIAENDLIVCHCGRSHLDFLRKESKSADIIRIFFDRICARDQMGKVDLLISANFEIMGCKTQFTLLILDILVIDLQCKVKLLICRKIVGTRNIHVLRYGHIGIIYVVVVIKTAKGELCTGHINLVILGNDAVLRKICCICIFPGADLIVNNTVYICHKYIDTDLARRFGDMAVHSGIHDGFRNDEIAVFAVIRIDISYGFTDRIKLDFSVSIGGFFIGKSTVNRIVIGIRLFDGKGIFTISDMDILHLVVSDQRSRRSVFDKSLTDRKMHKTRIRSIGIFGSVMEDVVELTAFDHSRSCGSNPAGTRSYYRTHGFRIRYEEKAGRRIVVDRLRIRNVPDDLSGDVFVDILVFLRIITGMVGICIHFDAIRSNTILVQVDIFRVQDIENDDRTGILDDPKVLCRLDCLFETASRSDIDIDRAIFVALIGKIEYGISRGKISDIIAVKCSMLQHLIGLVLEVLDHAVYIRIQFGFGEGSI